MIRDEIMGDFVVKKGHTGMIAEIQVQVDPLAPHVENQKKRYHSYTTQALLLHKTIFFRQNKGGFLFVITF